MVGKIYHEAESVIALGPYEDDSNEALALLHGLVKFVLEVRLRPYLQIIRIGRH